MRGKLWENIFGAAPVFLLLMSFSVLNALEKEMTADGRQGRYGLADSYLEITKDAGTAYPGNKLPELTDYNIPDLSERKKTAAEDTDGETAGKQGRIIRKISNLRNDYSAYYRFMNFDGSQLEVTFSMEKKAYDEYISGYGYFEQELEAMAEWRDRKERETAGGKDGPEFKEIKEQYDIRLRKFLRSRGLALRASAKTIEPDMPLIVKQNRALMAPVAASINRQLSAENNFSYDSIIGASLSLAQTAISYGVPPLVEKNGRHTVGIYPPVRVMLAGKGDCDTKTALLGAILLNYKGIKTVGISVPGHYLMAVRRVPMRGELFIKYHGLEYVLVEPAGPAWLPVGTVGENTENMLGQGREYGIEEFSL